MSLLRTSRAAGVLLVVLALLLGANACDEKVKKATGPTRAEQIIGDGISVDLAAKPTRRDLGLKNGETTLHLALPDHEEFEALVYFSNGQTLQIMADSVTIGTADGSSPPKSLGLTVAADDEDRLQQYLGDLTRSFGASAADATAARDAARAGTETSVPIATNQTGAEKLVASVDVSKDGHVTLNYQVDWSAS